MLWWGRISPEEAAAANIYIHVLEGFQASSGSLVLRARGAGGLASALPSLPSPTPPWSSPPALLLLP